MLDSIKRVISRLKGPRGPSHRPEVVAHFKKGEKPLEVSIKNVGNEAAEKGKISCFTQAGRNLPERLILEREFPHLYPFSDKEYTLLDIQGGDKKLIVRIEYQDPRGKRYSGRQEFDIRGI
jgi:hypothetical protein